MNTLLISFFAILLLLLSLFLILIILMQRANTNAGLGTAFGGGLTESAFGAQAGNVLTRTTILACSLFFIVSFGLYLAYLKAQAPDGSGPSLPDPAALSSEATRNNLPLQTHTSVSTEPRTQEQASPEQTTPPVKASENNLEQQP